jgi:Zn-dependent peptidase ImmA (M78 family)/transcriptional regulator with XRE-family HTH domain
MGSEFLGQKLHMARLFHGFSLQELGEKVHVSKQFLQQLENQKNAGLSNELEAALALTLQVKSSFFYLPISTVVTEDKCHFRKLRTTPTSVKLQALSHASLFSKLVNDLDQYVDFPEVDFPQYEKQPLTPNDIELAAEKCRKKWGLGLDTPIKNMIRVLENAGAVVTEFGDVSEKVDAFSMDLRRPLIIRNLAKGSVCRARFDLAHECGHLVMHGSQETGDVLTENEAHRFAGAFLIPRSAFIKEFSFLKESLQISWSKLVRLKIRWGVSLAAIIHRASDLGLIDALEYRRAFIHLRKSGQSKSEVGDDKIMIEEPEVLSNAVNLLSKHSKHSLLLILEGLGVEPGFFGKLIGLSDPKRISALFGKTQNLLLYQARS